MGVGLYSVGPGGARPIAGHCAFDAGNVRADGSFVLDIATGAESMERGLSNRIDTLGRRKVALVCRIVGHGGAVAVPETLVRRAR